MDRANAILSSLAETLLAPLVGSPATALVLVAVVAGLVMTVVFRYTSNQRGLRRVADRTKAMLLGMRLFKDDLRVALRFQGGLLAATGRRLLYSLPPTLVLVVPFVVVLVQLGQRYEHRPLAVGEQAVVEVHVAAAAWPQWREAGIEAPAGVEVETPALRDEARRALSWRLRVTAPTTDPIRWRSGDAVVEKRFSSARDTHRLRAVSRERPGPTFGSRVLHPGEPALARDGPLRRIVVRYPRRSTPILGVDVPWWATILIVSILTALLARPLLRVQF